MNHNYTPAERFERASLRVALLIRGIWEETGRSDTRLLEAPLLPDELTVVGQSKAFSGRGRREHVVPRLVIIKHCLEMLKNKATDDQIAEFIRAHVKIVCVIREEALQLDSAAQHRLKQRMPADWIPGGNPFARLEAARIDWLPL